MTTPLTAALLAALTVQMPAASLDTTMVSRRIQAQKAELRACYQALLSRDPQAQGKLTVTMIVGRQGLITRAWVSASELEDKAAQACILHAIHHVVFPSTRAPVRISYPIRFAT